MLYPFGYSGPAIVVMRRAAVIARLGSHGDEPPPRLAAWCAIAAAWCAIGAVLAVLAIPVLAGLDAVFH